jgi:membrane-associated phospholipid phosphatase
MLAALVRRVGGWIGRLFGRGERVAHAQEPVGVRGGTSVSQGPEDGTILPVRGGIDEPDGRARGQVDRDAPAWLDERSHVQPEASPVQPEAIAVESEASPVQPEAVEGTDAPLREATKRSLVPRWLAALRTQTFTGLAGIGLMIFGGLTFLVTGGLTADADLVATQAVQGIAAPWFGPLMLAVSAVGFAPQNVWIVAVIAALFWRAGYRTESGFALAASASVILTEGVKLLVGRPRPDADLVAVIEGAAGHSFPSGHTLFYVTFFGFLAYLAYAQLKPGRLRTAVLWLTGILIVLVGPSRIWMGQHWASDVLASYALGLTYLVVLVQMYARRRLGTLPAMSRTQAATR